MSLRYDIGIFKESTKPKEPVKTEKTPKNAVILLNGKQKVLDVFQSVIFSKIKQTKGLTSLLHCVCRVAKVSNYEQTQILTPKQMLQRLPIALAQVKPANTYENLNKIKQIIYYLNRAKEITKKVLNNIMN